MHVIHWFSDHDLLNMMVLVDVEALVAILVEVDVDANVQQNNPIQINTPSIDSPIMTYLTCWYSC